MNLYEIKALTAHNKINDLANKTAVTLSHTFADNTARDNYFTANPTELVDNLFIKVGAGYQQYAGSAWEEATAVVADLSGIESELSNLATREFKIKNDITNGDFSQGHEVGWKNFTANVSVNESVVVRYGSNASRFNSNLKEFSYIKNIAFPNGNKIYCSAWLYKISYTQGSIVFNVYDYKTFNNVVQTSFSDEPLSTWIRKSVVKTAANGGLRIQRALGSTAICEVVWDGVLTIDLTAIFGAGLEPTLSEMDTLINLLGGWFDGEITLTQKQLANWYLKMIRQNRNAIIALGGTIV